MQDYVQPAAIDYHWNLGKHIIMAFNFPGKWEYDDNFKYFHYKLNVGSITVSPGFDQADIVIFLESDDKYNAPSVVMDISSFNKEQFIRQVQEICPAVIWPIKAKPIFLSQ